MKSNSETLKIDERACIMYSSFVENSDAKKLIQLINADSQPKTIVKRLDVQFNILHSLIDLVNVKVIREDDLVLFVSLYSESLNLNFVNDENQTILHVIAVLGLEKLATIVFNPKFQFSSPCNFYALNNYGKTPAELASHTVKNQFNAAMQKDFTDRIVLVTSFATNSIFNYLIEKEHPELDYINPDMTVINYLTSDDGLISNDGTIGSHLNFQDKLYDNYFVDRPHTHWSWNQLCHANSGGSWETALFAVLDPLNNFSNVEGCVPYDTTIMGAHTLSAQSTILVPNQAVEQLKIRLEKGGFRGKVQGYNWPQVDLRTAVNEIISQHYPNASTLYNGNQNDISKIVIHSPELHATSKDYNYKDGYFKHLSIKINDVIRPLMVGNAAILLESFRQYSRDKHVGMHDGSPTDIENDPLIIVLKKLSSNPIEIFDNTQHLVSNNDVEKTAQNIIVLRCYQIYCTLRTLSGSSGAHHYANYILKKAVIIDFIAYHFEIADEITPPSNDQLKSMIKASFDKLLNVLDEQHAGFDFLTYRDVMKHAYEQVMNLTQSIHDVLPFSIWRDEPATLHQLLTTEMQSSNSSSSSQQTEDVMEFSVQSD